MVSFDTGDGYSRCDDIEGVDYAILSVLEDADGFLWKKRIYDRIMEGIDRLPFLSETSPQTIGRHVDAMEDEGVLVTEIVSVDGEGSPDRRHMIGYDLTAEGGRIVQQYREMLIESLVRSSVSADGSTDLSKQVIVSLMVDAFGIEAEGVKEIIAAELEESELRYLLFAYYFQRRIVPRVNEEMVPYMKEVIEKSEVLQKILSPSFVSATVGESGE